MKKMNFKDFNKLLTIKNILEYVLYAIATLWLLSLIAICLMNSWVPVIIFGSLWLIMYLVDKKYKNIEDKVYKYKFVIINNKNNGTTCSKAGD